MATTNISSSDILSFNDTTGAVQLTSGTTAERPGSASNGEMRYNTTDNKVEYYDGANWIQFTDFNPDAVYNYLVVAGGGGGGQDNGGGGGGAGGFRTSYGALGSGGGGAVEEIAAFTSGQTYTITIGSGGAAAASGVNSSLIGSNVSITSNGGGAAGGNGTVAASGGSGGGGRWNNMTGGAGTANQGFAGGNGTSGNADPYDDGGAGGGGAAGAGQTVTPNKSTWFGAGVGLANLITGSSVTYAEGGDGTPRYVDLPVGGATPGAANTGEGGDGGGRGGSYAAAGGSGIVILRMPTSKYSGTTTGSPTVTTDGSDTILTYTGSGTYTA